MSPLSIGWRVSKDLGKIHENKKNKSAPPAILIPDKANEDIAPDSKTALETGANIPHPTFANSIARCAILF